MLAVRSPRSWTRSLLPGFLGVLLLTTAAWGPGCRSQPWACCGQECGSECWPGPRIGCPEPCLKAPCPPEPYTPERPCPRPAARP